MFSLYLKDKDNVIKGYYKGAKAKKKTINGVSKLYIEIMLTQNAETTYKTYDRAERQCLSVQDEAREASGIDRNMYDIYIVDLDTGQHKQIIQADI